MLHFNQFIKYKERLRTTVYLCMPVVKCCYMLFLRANSTREDFSRKFWCKVSTHSSPKARSQVQNRSQRDFFSFFSQTFAYSLTNPNRQPRNPKKSAHQVKEYTKQTEQRFALADQHTRLQFPDHLPQNDKHIPVQIAVLAKDGHSISLQYVNPHIPKS